MTLRETLLKARENKKAAFIPFIMAGDPTAEETVKSIIALEKAGADALELGVPFSDPVADGETVQRAAERALKSGMTLDGVLDVVKEARKQGVKIPICLFSYLNPIYKKGYAGFISAAQDAGVNGALIVDLPPEEAEDYVDAAQEKSFETVFLCSPTTTPARLKRVDAATTGFVYYVSREGVTGAQATLAGGTAEKLAQLKTELQNPVAVGFGISTPEHVKALSGIADGIVVGSSLIKAAAGAENPASILAEKVEWLKTG
ncbi:MAG: tryptophan synthase subunit alpha [Alphaproteobacteria bacterium]|nr:tryptophan synthase subunit alpha [Alphaproteobacteria bacterium]